MLTVYDEYRLAVAVFNCYGDIVYKNPRAEKLIQTSRLEHIHSRKIRLMMNGLLSGLIRPPIQFHVDIARHQRWLCHINQWHQSYTLHLQTVPMQQSLVRPRLSRWLESLP